MVLSKRVDARGRKGWDRLLRCANVGPVALARCRRYSSQRYRPVCLRYYVQVCIVSSSSLQRFSGGWRWSKPEGARGRRGREQYGKRRERILNTARELFYREGARSVGVDTVVAQSGVAKTSLYRWFPSKDALIAAVIEAEAKDRWAGWDYTAQRSPADPREQLRAQLAGIAKFVSSPKYRGCPS